MSGLLSVIRSTPKVLGEFLPVVQRGDLGQQNALFRGTLTGVLDLEDARLAHPLLGNAWCY